VGEYGFTIDLIEKVVSKLEAAMTEVGTLNMVESIDWGASFRPTESEDMPLLFVTPRSSRHPGVVAAGGAEGAYDDEITLLIVVYVYILEDGHREALMQASQIFDEVKKICHANKLWDDLVYTSELGEGEDVGWGMVPWRQTADNVVYGISAPLLCKRRGQE